MFNSILPSVVIECLYENHVIKTMQFLSDSKYNKMPFSIQSGGHGFGGYLKKEGGAVINVYNLKNIEIIDNDKGIISVQSGVTMVDLAQFMIDNERTNIIFPLGDCPTVSMGGFA
eukprot:310081_1